MPSFSKALLKVFKRLSANSSNNPLKVLLLRTKKSWIISTLTNLMSVLMRRLTPEGLAGSMTLFIVERGQDLKILIVMIIIQ